MHVLDNKATVIQSPAKKRRFQHSVENLRGLSILFVVLSHITSMRAVGPVGEAMSFLFQDATALFVFISGYLFNYIEQDRFSYREYLIKKAKFVVLPYLILSVPAVLAGLVFKQHEVIGLSTGGYSLWSLLVGGAVIIPMWFVPMIVVFFLVSPLFHRLGASRMLPVATVMALGISLLTARPLDNLNPFLSFVHFAGFYLLGILLSARFEDIKQSGWTGILIVVPLILFLSTATVYFAMHGQSPMGFVDGLGQFNFSLFGKLTLLLAVLFLFDRFLNVNNRFLGWMAEISFGLFFMHGFFMALFTKFGQRIVPGPPIIVLAVELVFVLGGAIFAVVVAKRVIGKGSRYVIGC